MSSRFVPTIRLVLLIVLIYYFHMLKQIEIPLSVEKRYHSVFACPVSKEQSTEANPPMMMNCGHVITKDSLQKLSKPGGCVLTTIFTFFAHRLTRRQTSEVSLLPRGVESVDGAAGAFLIWKPDTVTYGAYLYL